MQRLTKEAKDELIETAYYSLNRFNEQADRPTLTLVLGQMGSPTSAVQREIEAERRPQGGAVLVSGWDIDRLAAGEGYDAEDVDTQALTMELIERALKDRVNVVVTPSPTTEEMPLAMIAAARRQGYEVEVAALAVNPKLAATQTFQRALIPGMETNHSDAFLAREAANVGKALRRIEANGAADRIMLYDRNAQLVDRSPGQSASEAFEGLRGALSGADKIRQAAAWEEISEAYERSGDRMPENGQRMREQAHYTLRQSAGASMNFDHRHPEHISTSQALAEKYGLTLARLYDGQDRGAVADYPELTNAFLARAMLDRVAKDQGLPEVSAVADSKIRDALIEGRRIQAPELRAEQQADRSTSFELER